MKEAIEKAIEGGYEQGYAHYNDPKIQAITVLDPLFWQCLGKNLGWEGSTYHWVKDGQRLDNFDMDGWQVYWHRFIDHLAEGKDADSFFTTLLNK